MATVNEVHVKGSKIMTSTRPISLSFAYYQIVKSESAEKPITDNCKDGNACDSSGGAVQLCRDTAKKTNYRRLSRRRDRPVNRLFSQKEK
jgi:hypothetical protein